MIILLPYTTQNTMASDCPWTWSELDAGIIIDVSENDLNNLTNWLDQKQIIWERH